MTHLCRICNSADFVLISRQVAGAPDSAVYKCRQCEIIYLFPIMTEEEEASFYRAEFEKYMEGRSGGGWKSPTAHFRSNQAEGERRLPLVRLFLKTEDDALEIGSSTGYFLDDLRGYVRSAIGVEPSRAYREYANSRGIQTFESINDLGARKFDVIFLYYVVEHLRNPIDYLASLKVRLNRGGRIFIEVPNVDDVLLSVYTIPNFPPFYWQKAHYYNFSSKTLSDALTRAGYKVQLIPVQRYDISNHLVWMMEGKSGGTGRFKNLFTPELEIAYAEALKAQWRCDTIFSVAEVES